MKKLFRPWWHEHITKEWVRSASNARGGRELRGLIVYFEPTSRLARACGFQPLVLEAEPRYSFKNDKDMDLGYMWVKEARGVVEKNARIGYVVIFRMGREVFAGNASELVRYHKRLFHDQPS